MTIKNQTRPSKRQREEEENRSRSPESPGILALARGPSTPKSISAVPPQVVPSTPLQGDDATYFNTRTTYLTNFLEDEPQRSWESDPLRNKKLHIPLEGGPAGTTEAARLLIPGTIGPFVHLYEPKEWQRDSGPDRAEFSVQLGLAGLDKHVLQTLMQQGPYPTTTIADLITIKVRARDLTGLDLSDGFPYLFDGNGTTAMYPGRQLPATHFLPGCKVVAEAALLAYEVQKKTGYSFLLLKLYKTGAAPTQDLWSPHQSPHRESKRAKRSMV